MKKYEGDDEWHFQKKDDNHRAETVRGTIFKGWTGHRYTLLSHHTCGFHMQRVGDCRGECYVPYGYKAGEYEHGTPRANCAEFICVAEHTIGRAYRRES